MKSKSVWIAVMVMMAFGASAHAEEKPDLPAVEEIEDHLDELYRSESSQAKMTMTIVTERRGTRELTLEAWTAGSDNALFVIRAPSREAGTATLRTEEGLWNYAPRADRLVRVPTGMLSDDWMGSHLTNDDLVRETEFRQDYTTELSWADHQGESVLKATMIPREGAPVVYSRVEYLMDAEEWTPMKATFYDDDKKVRTLSFSDVRQVGQQQVPHRMVVSPEDRPSESTTLEYQSLEFGVDIDDSIFTRRGLRRIAR